MIKRSLCLCLAAVLLLGLLGGCSGTKSASNETQDASGTVAETTQTATQYAYQAKFYDLPEELNWIGESCVSGGLLYFTANVPRGEEQSYTDESGETYTYYDTYVECLFRFDPNDGTCEQLTAYVPEPEDAAAYQSNTSVQAMTAGADGTLWLYRYTDCYAIDDSGQKTISELIQLDADGTLLRTITANQDTEIDAGDEGYFSYIDTLLADDLGNLYTYDYQTINVYGSDGSLLCSLSDDEAGGQLCQLSDSEIGVVATSADGQHVFRQFDAQTKSWGKETPVVASAWSIYPGDDVYTYYFTYNGSIYAERRDTGETEKVVDWLSCDVDSNDLNSDDYGFLSDGRITAVSYDYRSGGNSRNQIVVLDRVEASAVQTKTELTLACFSLDYNLRSQIVKFNRSNPDYRIVVTEYMDYSQDTDYTAGLTKLTTQILSGNVPDLIASNLLLPVKQYAAKGLLEDLWTYIDADPEYSRDSFMQQPLNAVQTDGKLYQLPLDFSVSTAIGLGKVVGAYDTWTLADLKDALAKLPEGATVFDRYVTQDQVLQYCVMMNADAFMNWQDKSCNFESDTFKSLLEFTALFPAEYDYSSDDNYESDFSRMKTGKQLLYMQDLSDFDNIYYTFAALNDDVCFVGFPREDGSSGSTFDANVSLCITTTCKDKSGAWTFIRSTLSDEYQNSLWNFPIVKSVFEQKVAEAMEQEYELDENGDQVLDENGDPIPVSHGGMAWGDEDMIELYAVTQEQYDAILSLIDSTVTFAAYDTNILNIISEEAAGYLAGDKSVDEVARLIQSRVNLYMQEQA